METYDKEFPGLNENIAEVKDKIDFDFICEDLPNILTSMQVGTDRIREIVLSLRVFSRLDESDCKEVDIHEGIESTLMLLGKRLKATSETAQIQVVKQYGQLPLVECYGGSLNQVFMNICLLYTSPSPRDA